ncbi:Response regulator receiver domain-containing protein [Catalinimonas alkaloidigena]|uniref:Response regulator receiver domain-containing protein n=2 Tax=Catalinimonas alkaloidigena TaxID=1075417 RepID=A0A1G9P4U0_9BACT|nr:Response regulator receiver domain-containing protein [Catalinimonas alkaloidigena]
MLLHHLQVAEQVLSVVNGQQALALLHACTGADAGRDCPDLILLDINMPVMNGLEFLEEFQGLSLTSTPRVVICTSSQEPYELSEISGYGVMGILTKPLKPDNLHAMLALWQQQ